MRVRRGRAPWEDCKRRTQEEEQRRKEELEGRSESLTISLSFSLSLVFFFSFPLCHTMNMRSAAAVQVYDGVA